LQVVGEIWFSLIVEISGRITKVVDYLLLLRFWK
jgi:hypothetical protein